MEQYTVFAVAAVQKTDTWYSFIHAADSTDFTKQAAAIMQKSLYNTRRYTCVWSADHHSVHLLRFRKKRQADCGSRKNVIQNIISRFADSKAADFCAFLLSAKRQKEALYVQKEAKGTHTPEQAEEIRTKDFFDMILPGTNQIPFRPLYLGRQLSLCMGDP